MNGDCLPSPRVFLLLPNSNWNRSCFDLPSIVLENLAWSAARPKDFFSLEFLPLKSNGNSREKNQNYRKKSNQNGQRILQIYSLNLIYSCGSVQFDFLSCVFQCVCVHHIGKLFQQKFYKIGLWWFHVCLLSVNKNFKIGFIFLIPINICTYICFYVNFYQKKLIKLHDKVL